MNISTATILNLLSPKINSSIKEKIENASINGKIDLSTISKEKGIQTLLTGLFKEILTGAQNKENITSLLQNNKQTFSFKNLSEDIKTLIKSIQTDPATSSKLETQLSSLKSSLIDIKNVDDKVIKTNISNSGVFLESKLAQQATPVSKNIDNLLSLIKAQLDILDISQIKSDMPKDLKLEIKSAIENILKDIKNIKLENNLQNQSSQLLKIDSQVQNIQKDFTLMGQNFVKYETTSMDNLDGLKAQLKDQLSILNGAFSVNVIESKLNSIDSNNNIPKDLKLEIKNAVESLLRDIKNVRSEQTLQKQLQNLTLLEAKVLNTQKNIASLETKITTNQQNSNTPIVKNDLANSIKDLFLNFREQIMSKNSIDIKNGFTLLNEKIVNLNEQTLGVKNIKIDLANTFEQLKSLNMVKIPQQQQVILQNLLGNTQLIQSKLETLPQALFENNLSKSTNFINDLKITAGVIEEYTKMSNEPITKELKTIIDKINTQIDFYQLLSYSTNSTHTYLSFLQDEIEDSDIRFKKNNDESFSCQINLTLKQYGDLKILMILDDKKNININIGLEQEEFKSLIQENLQKLRIGINNINLLIQSLNIFSLNNNEQKSIKNSYGNSNGDLSFGLDIKA